MAKVAPLYVQRKLLNPEPFIKWFKEQGFEQVLSPEELHVTICYSKKPVDWEAAGDHFDNLRVAGGTRRIEQFDKGATVMTFTSLQLQQRHQKFKDAGASFDFDPYTPHITITYKGKKPDNVRPYRGVLEFGPEIYEPIKDDYAEKVVEKAEVKKFDEVGEQRMVWAEVYAPNRPDSGGDYMTAEEIRKAAYNFMKSQRLDQVDQMHDNRVTKGINVVESFIAREDDNVFIPGSWVVGVHIDDDATWAKVKKGELNGYSLEAVVYTEEEEVEIDLPPVISGKTTVEKNHSHDFYAAFDEQGRFLGGRTSVVDGHMHVIKAGTVTEREQDHSHRFSVMDDVIVVGD